MPAAAGMQLRRSRRALTIGPWSYPIASPPSQDHRTPDTRDAASDRGTSTAPEVMIVEVPEPAQARGDGLDWFDVGVGAASLLAFMVLGFACAALILPRRPGAPHRIRSAG